MILSLRIFLLTSCFFWGCKVLITEAQPLIQGRVFDQQDSSALPYATLSLKVHGSTRVVAYTTSDSLGNYRLRLPTKKNTLVLEARYLGYHPFSQRFLVGDTVQDQKVNLDVALKPDVVELSEVVIRDPVILKKDTIIYDISYFMGERDETLEDVLEGMPGVKVLPDGSLEINGQAVDKVLIGGEEISDQGAAVLTRSLSPENVAAVEVRFDEKSHKIKESLLDASGYVVLDIKLDEELDRSFFGKGRATLGQQGSRILPGGYANLFRLDKPFKAHLFVEHDDFDQLNLSLENLKNLGADARSALFSNPADFNELKARGQFNQEIYGFDGFTLAQGDILGLTTKYTLSPSLDIYLGSYNSHRLTGEEQSMQQTYQENETTARFSAQQRLRSYDSKNKLDIRFDKHRLKLRWNANLVLFQKDFDSQHQRQQLTQEISYDFQDRHRALNHYHNLKAEYLLSERIGLGFDAHYTDRSEDLAIKFNHEDTSYASFFQGRNQTPVFSIRQKARSEVQELNGQFTIQYKVRTHQLRTGWFYEKTHLSEVREGENEENANKVDLFNGTAKGLEQSQYGAFINYHTLWRRFTLDASLRYTISDFLSRDYQNQRDRGVFYRVGLNYNPGNFNFISLNFSKQLTPAPLRGIVQGALLSDFQTLIYPNPQTLPPTNEHVFSLSASRRWRKLGVWFEPALLYGRIQNTELFASLEQTSLIIRTSAQRLADYIALSLPLRKSFKKAPISLALEPEWLRNRMENPTENSFTTTDRFLLGLRVNTDFDKCYNFSVYPKYTLFVFDNQSMNLRELQTMISFSSGLDLDLFQKKLLLTLQQRTVLFTGNTRASLANIGVRLRANSQKKLSWFLILDNLLNNRNFVQQEIFPNYFNVVRQGVFGRYAKFGLTLKII